MTALSVTVVASGGLPVTEVSTSNNLGIAVSRVDSGGLPVTLVTNGLPIVTVSGMPAPGGSTPTYYFLGF